MKVIQNFPNQYCNFNLFCKLALLIVRVNFGQIFAISLLIFLSRFLVLEGSNEVKGQVLILVVSYFGLSLSLRLNEMTVIAN